MQVRKEGRKVSKQASAQTRSKQAVCIFFKEAHKTVIGKKKI